jgi:hypothetical protein
MMQAVHYLLTRIAPLAEYGNAACLDELYPSIEKWCAAHQQNWAQERLESLYERASLRT